MSIVFVDTAIPNSRRKRLHVAYDPAAKRVIRVRKLAKLLNQGYTEVYIDALFPEICSDVRELLKRARVYLLRDPKNREEGKDGE